MISSESDLTLLRDPTGVGLERIQESTICSEWPQVLQETHYCVNISKYLGRATSRGFSVLSHIFLLIHAAQLLLKDSSSLTRGQPTLLPKQVCVHKQEVSVCRAFYG